MRISPILTAVRSSRTRFLPFALALVIAVIGVSLGCSSDGDPDPSGSPDGTNGATETPNGSDASPTEVPTGELAELLDLINTFMDGVDGKIVYDYVSNFGQHADGTYTTYYQGDLDRHDWLRRDGFETTLVTLVAEDAAYICSLVPAFPTCQVLSAEDAVASRPAYLIIPINFEALVQGVVPVTATRLPDEEIAGVEGLCYQADIDGRLIAGPPGTERMKLCFTDEGGLLLLDHDLFFDDPDVPDGALDFVALEVGQPTASDFEPPAELAGP